MPWHGTKPGAARDWNFLVALMPPTDTGQYHSTHPNRIRQRSLCHTECTVTDEWHRVWNAPCKRTVDLQTSNLDHCCTTANFAPHCFHTTIDIILRLSRSLTIMEWHQTHLNTTSNSYAPCTSHVFWWALCTWWGKDSVVWRLSGTHGYGNRGGKDPPRRQIPQPHKHLERSMGSHKYSRVTHSHTAITNLMGRAKSLYTHHTLP